MNQVDQESVQVPKIFAVCDRSDTAPVWGYILRQQGLSIVLEPPTEKAIGFLHHLRYKNLKKSEIVPY